MQAEAMVELVATLKLVHKVEVQLLPNLKKMILIRVCQCLYLETSYKLHVR